jgi:hypothetical protein
MRHKVSLPAFCHCCVVSLALSVWLAVAVAPSVRAQANGLLWVRFFEDRNSSGTVDAGEPLITRDVAVALLDAEGVVVASTRLNASPTAAQGMIGFQNLEPGTYSVVLTSAVWEPTGAERVSVRLAGDGIPVIVEYGARPARSADGPSTWRGVFGLPIYLGQPEQVARAALSLFAALMIAIVMVVIGLLIYTMVLRRRHRRELAALRLHGDDGEPAVISRRRA